MIEDFPPHVQQQVRRILRNEARRLLALETATEIRLLEAVDRWPAETTGLVRDRSPEALLIEFPGFDVLVSVPWSKAEPWTPHRKAMRKLAAFSFDPCSLDRDLEDEINHRAWGATRTGDTEGEGDDG